MKAEIESKKETQIAAKTEKNGQDKVKAETVIKEDVQVTAENQNQKSSENLDESYQDIPSFLQTGEISLFNINHYKVSVLIGLIWSRIRPVVCIVDSGAGPNPVIANFLDQSLLKNIQLCDMPEIQSVSDTKLVVSRANTFHLRIGESQTRVTYGVVDRLPVPVLLGTTFIDNFIKSCTRPKGISCLTTPRRYLS